MRRVAAVGVFLVSAVAISVAINAQGPGRRRSFTGRAGAAVRHDVSPALRDIPADLREHPDQDRATHAPLPVPKGRGPFAPQRDGALQDAPLPSVLAAPTVNFDGVNNRNGVLPPDTNGDVGLDRYMQWVNLSYAVYDKSGGQQLAPTNGNTVFQGFGGPCETRNDGDPIVLYDEQARRWLLSQFALPNYPSGPFYQCIAVSTSADPAGSYARYQFTISNTELNDYPKFGVWTDGYYMTVNQFSGNGYAGAGIVAFERDAMLAGQPARMVYVDTNDVNLGGMLPADIDGPNLPASGTPNFVIQFDDNTPADQLEVWQFAVDWAAAGGPTGAFELVTTLPVAGFDSNLCNYSRSCIPQPGTSRKLDTLSDRLMYRLQYRRFADGHESFVTNHTVDVNGADRAGIRWYEARRAGGVFSLAQQGTFSPDATHRWMGSAAMDEDGNIALAYNTSSSTQYPSIRYTGRLAGDAAGQMTLGESDILVGSGSQTSTSSRWGDYSNLSVDPSDGCTFWATLEYTNQGSIFNPAPWRTRIAAFALSPACGGGTANPPAAPTNLAATAAKRSITLTWTDNSTDETGFEVLRCVGTCTPSASDRIATTAANATSYKNNGLKPNSTYSYSVRACNGTVCSAPAGPVTQTAK